jgi:hypothetical protein
VKLFVRLVMLASVLALAGCKLFEAAPDGGAPPIVQVVLDAADIACILVRVAMGDTEPAAIASMCEIDKTLIPDVAAIVQGEQIKERMLRLGDAGAPVAPDGGGVLRRSRP